MTKETKHTPAPWSATRGFDAMHISGATTEKGKAFCTLTGNDWEQAVANAQLIAAAPELFEALKNIIDDPCGTLDVVMEPWKIEDSKQAIAKAEGK